MLRGKDSIQRRLVMMSALSSTFALFLACAGFLVFELVTFKERLQRDLTTDAQVLAVNVTAPLLFDDDDTARASLAALAANPRIRSAVLTRAEGSQVFAEYRALAPERERIGQLSLLLSREHVRLTLPVVSEGATIGRLTLEAGLDEQTRRVSQYVKLSLMILLVSLVTALIVATALQRRISKPIENLTLAAEHVSKNQDYNIRVEVPREDELGRLARTFNTMLGRIEEQSTELKKALEARDVFLGIASHELKTPLTPLTLQVQSLLRAASGENPAALVPKLQRLEQNVARLARLVDDLLDISRLSIQTLVLHPETTDLSELVKGVAEQYADEAQRKGTPIKVTAPTAVIGSWDPARLEQIVVNLISNALKYGPGKPVEVTVEQVGARALVVVQDQGIGILEEDLVRIFERYERAVSEKHYGGFGLGLWIVRETLTLMGGTVRATSAPGQGARFEVVLPLGPRPATAVGATDSSSTGPGVDRAG